MKKYTFVFVFFNALFILIAVGSSTCPQPIPFPSWMIGHFQAQFADGSTANETFELLFANITYSNGNNGTLIMTKPLNKSDHFFICYDCIHIQGTEPQQRCSLLVPNCNGYKKYVHKTPELVSVCPESTSSPDVVPEIIERNG
ncbi:hypothetical protein I4U23_022144 [Adineta vaga]|nr:hypothetical protein I4U23_022144 [Adineta vaga]